MEHIEIAWNDTLDSREIDERIEELESLTDRTADEQRELDTLIAFRDEVCGYSSEWFHGIAFIRDSYFKDYAQDLAEDISGATALTDVLAEWPYTCIDWEQAARELRMDYTSAELDGVTYWYL